MERLSKLLVSNIPVDCPGEFLKQWIEARGYLTFGVKLTEGFAYVQLMDPAKLDEAIRALDGQHLQGQPVQVRRVVQVSSIVRPAVWMNAVGA